MSENVGLKRLKKAQRLQKIKEMIPEGKTYGEIAEACGVNIRTIDRDVAEWNRSGGLEQWLRQEFFALHREVKRMDGRIPQAYSTVANLLGKTLTQKIEAKNEGQQTIVVKVWKPDAEPDGGDKVLP